ncbi:GNAT family N-acetyltransferase [Helcobacillus massiliensis]|uniref:GNAT family N-acetyltransferase n=1 Tax=Helcobacillus massiliensis TaxID=521392 RepID=UPI0021A5B35D|nr:N-acetyltransferase [Helcobacillus massiliensis]MCT1556863.1 GNAT family N-acetyltransferase [Helcobacillus massiliensis]MCT2035687.1 GNAT family N-acetyltransferase [Helcobacillus massiliensis]MCT2330861.1 GNAT family N-acetyltransferase [Helcobacillus massiliensis]
MTEPTPASAPAACSDRAAALRFIASMQADPATATAYVGTLEEGLETELEDLDQDWMDTLRVCLDSDGSITGAVLLEWDDEVGMSWIHGPWCTPDTWDRDAVDLLRAAVEQAPVGRHEIYADLSNTRLADLAADQGWRGGTAHCVMRISREAAARADESVRPVRPGDLDAVRALHEAAFPGTYATARQLVDGDQGYRTLVADSSPGSSDGKVIGFITGQEDDGDIYLDFLAVDPAHRRQGVARRLIGALAAHLPGKDMTLTVADTSEAALALYDALGWERTATTRGYRWPA